MEAILRRVLIVENADNNYYGNLLVATNDKKWRVFFDERGMVTRVENYAEKEQYLEDNLSQLFSEFINAERINFNHIQSLTPEDRERIKEYLEKTPFQEKFTRGRSMFGSENSLTYTIIVDIPDIIERNGKVWVQCEFDVDRKNISRARVFTQKWYDNT